MIKLFRDQDDYILQNSQRTIRVANFPLDQLFQSDNPTNFVSQYLQTDAPHIELTESDQLSRPWLPPISHQEVWAAGVTYYRSRSARMEESQASGGDRFYDLVYEAERPEIFFKATGPRTRGHLDNLRIRSDSSWDVPEPELTLAINSVGSIFGYTIGNDMSSRSIEGENPLYLPQAKIYRGSCGLGPCLCITDSLPPETEISIDIHRAGETVFSGSIAISQIKRDFNELAEFLFRENEFTNGAYLMTGTGVVPGGDFTLQSGDETRITIESLGTLTNSIE